MLRVFKNVASDYPEDILVFFARWRWNSSECAYHILTRWTVSELTLNILHKVLKNNFVDCMTVLIVLSSLCPLSHLAIGCSENLCIWEAKSGNLLYKLAMPDGMCVSNLVYISVTPHLPLHHCHLHASFKGYRTRAER